MHLIVLALDLLANDRPGELRLRFPLDRDTADVLLSLLGDSDGLTGDEGDLLGHLDQVEPPRAGAGDERAVDGHADALEHEAAAVLAGL